MGSGLGSIMGAYDDPYNAIEAAKIMMEGSVLLYSSYGSNKKVIDYDDIMESIRIQDACQVYGENGSAAMIIFSEVNKNNHGLETD